MSDGQVIAVQEWAKQNQADGLPQIILPSGPVTITMCATKLFGLIAPTKQLFVRGGAVVNLVPRDDGFLALNILRPAAARSYFEKFAQLFAWRTGKNGEQVLKPSTCPEQMADALLHSEMAATLLPRLQGLINCPVIREVEGQLSIAGAGYDEHTRLLITAGKMPPVVPLDQAVSQLLQLFEEFDFQTEGDKSRAVASLITPALRAGGFLKGRAPADVAEADQSQSGKTYRQKVIAALYKERVSLVTSRLGGVGSIDESLSQRLVEGRPFIQFDNFRGRFDSAHLEAFLTAEAAFPCRVPHRGEITIPPENYFIFLTSNGVNTTPDLARRSNIIRNRKKQPGYQFGKFQEGDLLDRVRHWQAYYLGCVFAVIQHWHAVGKPRTNESRHDFRDWVQVVDWIVQNVFGLGPVMDGHQQAQERVSNPALVWLRSVVLAVAEAGELNKPLTATNIHELCDGADIAVPGLGQGTDELKGKKVIGTIMAKLFRGNDVLEMDGYQVTREEKFVSHDRGSEGGNFKSKTYTMTKQ